VGSKIKGNGIILQNRLKGCVMMDVHKKCLQTWGVGNYQTFKKKVYLSSCKRKDIMATQGMIKRGVGPPQLGKHTPPKWVYQIYETYSTNMEPPKSNFVEK
jgi:hypothetical protein